MGVCRPAPGFIHSVGPSLCCRGARLPASDRPSHPVSAADLTAARLVAIVESSDDAIVSKSLDGTVLSWNAAAERIFGYSAHEVVGSPLYTLIPPELHDDERDILARIGQGEHIAHFETIRRHKSGS